MQKLYRRNLNEKITLSTAEVSSGPTKLIKFSINSKISPSAIASRTFQLQSVPRPPAVSKTSGKERPNEFGFRFDRQLSSFLIESQYQRVILVRL